MLILFITYEITNMSDLVVLTGCLLRSASGRSSSSSTILSDVSYMRCRDRLMDFRTVKNTPTVTQYAVQTYAFDPTYCITHLSIYLHSHKKDRGLIRGTYEKSLINSTKTKYIELSTRQTGKKIIRW